MFLRYTKKPWLLREEILTMTFLESQSPIIVDEVQKVPDLLDEIHWIIENCPFKMHQCYSQSINISLQ